MVYCAFEYLTCFTFYISFQLHEAVIISSCVIYFSYTMWHFFCYQPDRASFIFSVYFFARQQKHSPQMVIFYWEWESWGSEDELWYLLFFQVIKQQPPLELCWATLRMMRDPPEYIIKCLLIPSKRVWMYNKQKTSNTPRYP